MALNREFAEILREKMGENIAPTQTEPLVSAKIEDHFQPILNFFTDKRTWFPHRGLKAYPKQKVLTQAIPKVLKQTISQPEVLFSMGSLNLQGQKALLEMKNQGAQINEESFSLKDLKREYRKLVKIYHPDHNKCLNSPQTFQNILTQYKTLISQLG